MYTNQRLIELGMYILYEKQDGYIARNIFEYALKYDADNPVIAFNLGFIKDKIFVEWETAESLYERSANNGYFFAAYFLYRRYTLEKYDHEKSVKYQNMMYDIAQKELFLPEVKEWYIRSTRDDMYYGIYLYAKLVEKKQVECEILYEEYMKNLDDNIVRCDLIKKHLSEDNWYDAKKIFTNSKSKRYDLGDKNYVIFLLGEYLFNNGNLSEAEPYLYVTANSGNLDAKLMLYNIYSKQISTDTEYRKIRDLYIRLIEEAISWKECRKEFVKKICNQLLSL